jgi:hypothetical protein
MHVIHRCNFFQVYVYDFDAFDNLKIRPRQILPYAILNIKTDLLKCFGLQNRSPIPRTIEPGNDRRARSPIPRIKDVRDRSPIPRVVLGKDQKDRSPIPRIIECRKDRRVIDVSSRHDKKSVREGSGHHSRSRSTTSRRQEQHSKRSKERSLSRRRKKVFLFVQQFR